MVKKAVTSKNFAKKEVLFIAKFFVVFFALQFLILIVPMNLLEDFIASFEANALGLQSAGNKIFLGSQTFEITPNCTGLLSGAILAAIIFSLKKPDLKKKAIMAIAGAVFLFALNLPRIYFVLSAGKIFGLETAELLHEISWMSTALIVIAIWFAAAKKIAKIKNFSELL